MNSRPTTPEFICEELVVFKGTAWAALTVDGWHVHISEQISPNGLVVVLPNFIEVLKFVDNIEHGKSSGS